MMQNEQKRILLVEDDEKLANLVKDFLESNGFSVLIEMRGDQAAERIEREEPDILILDWMLPGMDGLAICRQVRNRFNKPILMLTARGDEVDEIVGLEVGVDDYLAKPVRPRLLLARIHALLRRFESSDATGTDSQTDHDDKTIWLGNLSVDPKNRRAYINDREILLTTSEFDLLLYLARHSGELLERERIYQDVRGIEWDGLDRSIDLRIARLRKKLGDDARSPKRIKSVRGTGYLMVANP